jgi:uncharacterized protein
MELSVVHNQARSRFEAVVEGALARADYRLTDGTMHIFHTEVPRRLEGRGIAAAIVAVALRHALDNGLKVAPRCSYVRAYMRRHPETVGLLAEGHAV